MEEKNKPPITITDMSLINRWVEDAMEILPKGSIPTDVNGYITIVSTNFTDEEIDRLHRLNS